MRIYFSPHLWQRLFPAFLYVSFHRLRWQHLICISLIINNKKENFHIIVGHLYKFSRREFRWRKKFVQLPFPFFNALIFFIVDYFVPNFIAGCAFVKCVVCSNFHSCSRVSFYFNDSFFSAVQKLLSLG